MRKRTPRAIVALVTALAVASSATAQVVIEDSDFQFANWENFLFGGNGSGGTVGFRIPAGGNPGAYRQLQLTVQANGSIGSANFFIEEYDPAVRGAIQELTFSDSWLFVDRFDANAGGYAVLQDDRIYLSAEPFVFQTIGVWGEHSLEGLTAASFLPVGGGSRRPDFTSAGSPIRFGFWRSFFATPALTTTRHGIDNFRVVITNPPAQGVDLRVTKDSDRVWGQGDRVRYTITVVNDGTIPATGVVLRDQMRFASVVPELSPGWRCSSELGHSDCTFSVGRLEPGEQRVVTLEAWVSIGYALVQGASRESFDIFNEVTVRDDGTRGQDGQLANNRSAIATPFANPICVDSNCALIVLGCLLNSKGSANPTAINQPGGLLPYYRLRDRVMAATAGGLRYIALYYRHTPEISRLIRTDPQTRELAMATINAWERSLISLTEGGATPAISQPMVNVLTALLNRLKLLGSSELRQTIEREEERIDLPSLAGMNIAEARDRAFERKRPARR
jgi:hypothetical protein